MNFYLPLLYTHVFCAALSIVFFALRGFWMITASELLQRRIVRILPHIIDTILLSAAIGLAMLSHQYPLVNDWLTVKLVALIVYILLGTIALKRGKTKSQRVTAFVLALLTFGFIVSVALFHHPLGILYLLT